MANYIVLMGVSGSGKSSIGKQIAATLNYRFIEGDELHPAENIAKMSKGIALTDEDRLPWLQKIQSSIRQLSGQQQPAVISCSSLKKSYRDILRNASDKLLFIYLEGNYELIRERLMSREGHFMKDNLLTSQFNTLEAPNLEPDVITLPITYPPTELVELSIQKIKERVRF